ncbi:MAG: hypothetical protein U0V48_11235 [Anaerolineales bacterium]
MDSGGFREKYGMEFRKPKWDEVPNEGLIAGVRLEDLPRFFTAAICLQTWKISSSSTSSPLTVVRMKTCSLIRTFTKMSADSFSITTASPTPKAG